MLKVQRKREYGPRNAGTGSDRWYWVASKALHSDAHLPLFSVLVVVVCVVVTTVPSLLILLLGSMMMLCECVMVLVLVEELVLLVLLSLERSQLVLPLACADLSRTSRVLTVAHRVLDVGFQDSDLTQVETQTQRSCFCALG